MSIFGKGIDQNGMHGQVKDFKGKENSVYIVGEDGFLKQVARKSEAAEQAKEILQFKDVKIDGIGKNRKITRR